MLSLLSLRFFGKGMMWFSSALSPPSLSTTRSFFLCFREEGMGKWPSLLMGDGDSALFTIHRGGFAHRFYGG